MSNLAFDTLQFAKRAEAAGFTKEQAEFQAEEIVKIIDGHLATKGDIQEVKLEVQELRKDVLNIKDGLEKNIQDVRKDLEKNILDARKDLEKNILDVRKDLEKSIQDVRKDLEKNILDVRKDLEIKTLDIKNDVENLRLSTQKDMENLSSKLTIRFGSMMVVAIGILSIIIKLGH